MPTGRPSGWRASSTCRPPAFAPHSCSPAAPILVVSVNRYSSSCRAVRCPPPCRCGISAPMPTRPLLPATDRMPLRMRARARVRSRLRYTAKAAWVAGSEWCYWKKTILIRGVSARTRSVAALMCPHRCRRPPHPPAVAARATATTSGNTGCSVASVTYGPRCPALPVATTRRPRSAKLPSTGARCAAAPGVRGSRVMPSPKW